jgi:hypothetical protein
VAPIALRVRPAGSFSGQHSQVLFSRAFYVREKSAAAFSVVARLYRPRAEILDSSMAFPEPQSVERATLFVDNGSEFAIGRPSVLEGP